MRHALLSRFQGTLLAAALGDELGVYSRTRQAIRRNSMGLLSNPKVSNQKGWLAGWYPGFEPDSNVSEPPSFGGRAAISCARTLVAANGWDTPKLAAIADRSLNDTIAAELAIATLPIALFFHDDERQQRQRLLQIVKLWHCHPDAEAGLLAVGYALAQLLQDRLAPPELLPQTIAYLKQSTTSPTASLLELIATLEQAQTLVQQGAGLHAAIERLVREPHAGKGAIALSFYCFLTTPDDLQLSLLRAARCGEAAPAICALTGALSGAYQGMGGLQLAWQLADASCLRWGITDAALRQLIGYLFADWSGVYVPTMQLDVAAIAAPGVIRPR